MEEVPALWMEEIVCRSRGWTEVCDAGIVGAIGFNRQNDTKAWKFEYLFDQSRSSSGFNYIHPRMVATPLPFNPLDDGSAVKIEPTVPVAVDDAEQAERAESGQQVSRTYDLAEDLHTAWDSELQVKQLKYGLWRLLRLLKVPTRPGGRVGWGQSASVNDVMTPEESDDIAAKLSTIDSEFERASRTHSTLPFGVPNPTQKEPIPIREALSAYTSLVRMYPNDFRPLLARALARCSRNHRHGCEADLEASRKLAPHHGGAKAAVASLAHDVKRAYENGND